MRRKLLLALLIIVGAGVGLYYYLSPAASIFNKDTLPMYDVDTSNWKTYTHERYGFSFKYPPQAEQNDSAMWNPGEYSIDVRIPMRASSSCNSGTAKEYLGERHGTAVYRMISKNTGKLAAVSPQTHTDEICFEQKPGMVTVIYIGTMGERSDIGDGILNTFFLPQQDPNEFFLPDSALSNSDSE